MLQRLLPFGDCKGSHFFLASKSFSTFFLPPGFFLFHLDGVVRFMPCCVHRFLISGPDLRIDARFSPFPPSSVHRFLISGSDLGIDAAPSLLHRRIARLQRSRVVQAGTGWHEGGIILSKKPPEWRLSPPHQQSASDSTLRRSKEEKPQEWRLFRE